MERIGLLAGAGKLPAMFANAAIELGYEVYAVALLDETDETLKDVATNYKKISIGQLDALIRHLKENDVVSVTMLGKVTKELLFNNKVQPDAAMTRLIMTLPNRYDDTVMLAFINELQNAGMKAMDQTELIKKLMHPKGSITKNPNPVHMSIIIFSFSPKPNINTPARASETYNVFTNFFLIPRTPRNMLETSIPAAHIVSVIPRVFASAKARTRGSASI